MRVDSINRTVKNIGIRGDNGMKRFALAMFVVVAALVTGCAGGTGPIARTGPSVTVDDRGPVAVEAQENVKSVGATEDEATAKEATEKPVFNDGAWVYVE